MTNQQEEVLKKLSELKGVGSDDFACLIILAKAIMELRGTRVETKKK